MLEIRRIITDRTSEDRSVFGDTKSAPTSTALGIEFHNLWGTPDGIPTVRAGGDLDPHSFPFFPGAGGTRFIVVRFPPDSALEHDPDAERKQPGLVEVFEPDNPGMHTTDTIDYAVCVDGEMYLELDDGAEAHITPGTCIVQRGTRHAWRNRSDRACTLVCVLIGAERARR